jgi:hypothetical protein
MEANVNRVTVTIRELDDGVWRCGDGDPHPTALLMCGRAPEKRKELAKKLLAACVEILGSGADLLNVEFTRHPGDEMFHPTMGGLSHDLTPDEQ